MQTKVCIVKTMVFPVGMYGCESLTPKKAECQRLDAFELWCWRRLSRVPWTTRRSNQSILKEISPEYSLQGLILKLKLQYFGNLMRRADSLEKTLILRKMEGRRKMGTEGEMVGWHYLLNGHELGQTLGDGEGQGRLMLQSMGLQSQTWLSHWINWFCILVWTQCIHLPWLYNSMRHKKFISLSLILQIPTSISPFI